MTSLADFTERVIQFYTEQSKRRRSSWDRLSSTERGHWVDQYNAHEASLVEPGAVIVSTDGGEVWALAAKTTLPDSGEREVKENGFVREPDSGKANYVPLITARGLDIVPHELIKRIAEHYYQGGLKYAPDNWRRGTDPESLERNRRSAARHFVAWLRGETDEDHLAAVTWNMITFEINRAAKHASEILKSCSKCEAGVDTSNGAALCSCGLWVHP